jgi:Family of unknown function (DUF6312)
MAELLFGKNVRSISGLETDHFGRLRSFRIYRKKAKKKRKISWLLRPQEKALRRRAVAESTFADEYLRRHEKSAKKKRNGFLKDMPTNMESAYRKAFKRYFD